ncbi:MAG: hypothetical protein JO348_13445, partial [Alphaproteobacteria bacterium]|nr:hypothetical protein [Alphaproteobacteria bacterium]
MARRIGDIWQRLGTNGDASGTSGKGWRTFLSAAAVAAVLGGFICTINVMTMRYEEPGWGLAAPIIWEGTSFVSLLVFLWIAWIAWRLATPLRAPWWRVAVVHLIGAVAFSLAHVAGFVLLRKLIYWAFGDHYDYGVFLSHFLYELGKDAGSYALIIIGFSLTDYVFTQMDAAAPAHSALDPMFT